jgi:large exoprotein involved in heme utilization and adhesion
MKMIISLSALLTLMLFSCKKDDADIPIGTIKVDINGSAYTFNLQAKATTLTVTGGYGIQIQGYYRNGSTTNLSFSIVRPGAISTGTFTENAAGNPLVLMTHCTEVITPCVIRANAYGSTSNPASITITEITGSSVKGTFKGELQVSTGSTEVLSNGAFHVSF